MNTQLDKPDVQQRRAPQGGGYASKLKTLLDDYTLEDAWKAKNPGSSRGTFHRKDYSARLDYWFIPGTMIAQSSITISPQPLSDHCTVSLEISLAETKRGPGFWRFDNTLLTDMEFIEAMRTHLVEVQLEAFVSPNMRWEWIKYKIRSFTIHFSISRNRRRKNQVKDLEDRLEFIRREHDLTGSNDITEEVESIKRELKEIYHHRAAAAIFKAKARWSQSGEKPTAYFLGLEKRRSKDNMITSLLNSEGRSITDNKEILKMEQEYFSNIYVEDPSMLDPLDQMPIDDADVPKVPDLLSIRINRPFSIQDFYEALKALNKNKTPGSDGLTPEFYLTFWSEIKTPLTQSLHFSIEEGLLSDQQRTGIITLIPKKGLDRRYLTNWRPITLLNSDVKILSKALATRIQSCITEVVSHDQRQKHCI